MSTALGHGWRGKRFTALQDSNQDVTDPGPKEMPQQHTRGPALAHQLPPAVPTAHSDDTTGRKVIQTSSV